MEEKTRKIKSFVAGMLTFYFGFGFLGSGSVLIPALIRTSGSAMVGRTASSTVTFILAGIALVLFLVLINIGNNWKSWAIGILGAIAVNMATIVIFLMACFIAVGANSDALINSLMASMLAIPIILMIIAAWIYYRIISKDEKSNQNPQMRLWAE